MNVVAAHAGHPWGGSIATLGVVGLLMALLMLVAIVMDRRAP